MRIANGFVYFTQKEEVVIFACYYEALIRVKMDGAKTTLELVREHFIDGLGNLTVDVFENFLTVCSRLVVPSFDTVLNEVMAGNHPDGKGACFRIPNEKKDKKGHLRAIHKRRQWRDGLKNRFEESLDYYRARLHEGHSETMLCSHEMKVRSRKRTKTKPNLRVIEGRVG